MSKENKATARKIYEVISTGDFDRTEEIIHPDASDNECPPGTERHEIKLIESFERFVTEARAAFPDMRVTVEDLIAEGDRVATRVTMRGTHLGEFEGVAPTGKRVKVSAIDMFRFDAGRIVEHWGHADDLTAILGSPERP